MKKILNNIKSVNYKLFLILFLVTQSSCDLVKFVEKREKRKIIESGFKECFLADKNDTLHYYYCNSNKNKTILLLHGFGANALFQWHKTASELAKYYNVIIPDLVFFGKSKSLNNDFSIEYQVNAISKIIKDTKIGGQVSILGNSYGGLVATCYAETFPDRVDYLLLNNSLMKNFSIETADLYAKSNGENSIFNLLSPTTVEQLSKSLKIVYYKPPRIPNMFKKQFVKHIDKMQQISNQKVFEYLTKNEDFYKNKKYNFNNKTFFIWGSNDSLIPSNLALQMLNEYKINSQNLYIIEKTAHCPNLEKNKDFCLIVHEIVK